MSSEPGESEQNPVLPSAVNLPLLAEDVTFDISIKRAAPEERAATLEEKRATLTEKATVRKSEYVRQSHAVPRSPAADQSVVVITVPSKNRAALQR